MKTILTSGLAQLCLDTPPQAADQLAQYGQMLLEKNQVMNLTAIREPEQVARLHMLDCAALAGLVDLKGKTLIDVGTGAGFPGLPLKILVPSLELTLLDSLNKRLDWLEEVAGTLRLEGVRTVHARAEEQALVKGFRDSFDFATARAVADLRVLCELCLEIHRQRPRAHRGRPRHSAAGWTSARGTGLYHSGHRCGPPGGHDSKSRPHPEGISPSLGKNTKSAPVNSVF